MLYVIYNIRSKLGIKNKSKKLTNHGRMWEEWLELNVIGQFLTFSSYTKLILLIVDDALQFQKRRNTCLKFVNHCVHT